MNYKTKAQELSFLSRDYAVAKDKKNWLALFDKNALVQDPIGKSPLDPKGNGHKGLAAIEQFYDTVIANGNIEFTIIESIPCGDECANYAQIVNLIGEVKIETKMIVIYRINSNNKIESLRAFWDYQKMEVQLNALLST